MDLTKFRGTDAAVHGLLDLQQALRSKTKTAQQKATTDQPIPRHEQGDRFVRGPIPYEWLRVALAAGGKAGNLAWAIWWLAGMQQSNPIKLTGRVLRDFNISTRAARRLLVDFERDDLVEVDRQRGRGPIVTLLTPTTERTADE